MFVAPTAKKSQKQSGWQLVGLGKPSEVTPKPGRSVRQLDYKEVSEMSSDDAAWHLQNNTRHWEAAFAEQERRRASKKHVAETRVQLMWSGHATDEESEAARIAGETFINKFPQIERTLSNAQAMCRYMEENDLAGTELSSYITAFKALSENGELTLVRPESASEFYANHPELHPTGVVPPLILVREAKAANTAAHFEKAARSTSQAGSTRVTAYPAEQHGVPRLNEIEKRSLRQKVKSMSADELAARCAADPSFKKCLDSLE